MVWCCDRGWHARGLPDGAMKVLLVAACAGACLTAVEGGCVEAT